MSPLYLVTASKRIEFQIEVEADDVDKAIEIVNQHEASDSMQEYLSETSPLEIDEVEELEEE